MGNATFAVDNQRVESDEDLNLMFGCLYKHLHGNGLGFYPVSVCVLTARQEMYTLKAGH